MIRRWINFFSRGVAVIAAVFLAAILPLARAHAADPPVPPPYRAPYLPANDSEPLQEVPSGRDPTVVRMRSLRAAFDASPNQLDAAINLANAYIDYTRQIGDAHYAGYAEAVIAPWTSRKSPPASALLVEATILQYRHQFTEARDYLARAMQIDPRNGQAWLTLATLDMVQGDYAAARKDCGQVTNDAGFELGLACLGNLRSYTGQAQQSLAVLHQVEANGVGVSAAYQAWVDGLIAEAAERLGDWTLAETHYKAALKLLPEDNFLLVAYADFLLDRQRPAEVIPLLAHHEQSDTAFLRIALAEAALHSPNAPEFTWLMAARFAALRQRGSEYFGREEARFALALQHDPQESLDLAKRNWEVQRAPWDARVVLEAAAAAHRPQAATEVLDFIATTHLQDPIIANLSRELRGHP